MSKEYNGLVCLPLTRYERSIVRTVLEDMITRPDRIHASIERAKPRWEKIVRADVGRIHLAADKIIQNMRNNRERLARCVDGEKDSCSIYRCMIDAFTGVDREDYLAATAMFSFATEMALLERKDIAREEDLVEI